MSDADARWLLENSSGWFDPDCENASRHENVTVAVDADASLPFPLKVRWDDGAIGADSPDSFVGSFALLGPDVLAVVTRIRERLAAVEGENVDLRRKAAALGRELMDVNARLTAKLAAAKPGDGYIACRHCPFWKHVHYEEGGKLVAPGCSGFEPEGA